MGNGQPKRNALTEGARIDFRKEVNQLLADYHKTSNWKYSIVEAIQVDEIALFRFSILKYSLPRIILHVYFHVLVIDIRVQLAVRKDNGIHRSLKKPYDPL